MTGFSATPLSRRKVKTGCQTCKKRKVKCDEGWPACDRCKSTGRVCDGYGIWGGGGCPSDRLKGLSSGKTITAQNPPALKSPGTSPSRSLQHLSLDGSEKEGFEWFIHRSAVKLPGTFPSRDWNALLIQGCVSAPAIRHALLALSSAHKEEVGGYGYLGREHNDKQALFTVAQYRKAITHLRPCLTNVEKTPLQATLVSCILFVWADFLRGHYTNGLLHLEHGLNLLVENRFRSDDQEPQSTYVEGWILTIFTRLLVQAKLLGQLPRFECRDLVGYNSSTEVHTFRSIHHARRNLEHILLRAFSLQETLLQAHSKLTCSETGIDLLAKYTNIQTDLKVWIKTNETTISNLPTTTSFHERFAYRVLNLYYYQITIISDTCLQPKNETIYDQYIPTFRKIISFCIETHKLIFLGRKQHSPQAHFDPEPSSPNSVSDIGWIAPLYFTAVKCRDPVLRRQAIQLLKSTPHKEGIWSAYLAVVVAEKVLSEEEGGPYQGYSIEDQCDALEASCDSPSEQEVPMLQTLPPTSRLGIVDLVLPDDRAGKLTLKCCRPGCDGTIEMMSYQYDLRTRRWNDSTRSYN